MRIITKRAKLFCNLMLSLGLLLGLALASNNRFFSSVEAARRTALSALHLVQAQDERQQPLGRVVQAVETVPTDAAQRGATLAQNFGALIAQAQAAGSVRVIVGLQTPFQLEGTLNNLDDAQMQHRAIAQTQERVLNRLAGDNVTRVKQFSSIPFLAMEADAAALQHLQTSSDITSIQEDRPVPAALAGKASLTRAARAQMSNYTGAGQTVAILDTGVDQAQPFLAGKIVSEACYSTTNGRATSLCPAGLSNSTDFGAAGSCDPAIPGCNHGTYVAGVAAGKSSNFSGVAPDAKIIAIQVFSRFDHETDCGGVAPCVMTYTSDQILGLQRVQALSANFNIAAVNLSLGGSPLSGSICDGSNAALKMAIDNLRSMGIATIIAAGNDGNAHALGTPSCLSNAISVGSTSRDNAGQDVVSSFSNNASILNLLAPGDGFGNGQGTSMSAPYVTGAWAVLKSKSPAASVPQILMALQSTGLPVTDARNGLTKPRVQLDAAVNEISTEACNYAIAPTSKAFFAAGGTGSVSVTTTAGCTWTAVSNNSWITVNSGTPGNGNGTVNYTVDNNGGFDRTGTITIAGQTFTVIQVSNQMLAVDDGSVEFVTGLVNAGTSWRVNRLTPSSYPATINAVAIAFPSSNGVAVGDPVTILVGTNPSGNANIDGITFQTTEGTVQVLNQLSLYPVPPVTITSGDFVVGMKFTQVAGAKPFSLDTTTSQHRSYRSLDGNDFTIIDNIGTPGNYIIRALLAQSPSIVAAPPAAITAESCGTPNQAIDPGETVTVSFPLKNNGTGPTNNLVATLQATGGVTIPSGPQTYGALAGGGGTAAKSFTFKADPALVCGDTLTATLQLQDGPSNLGTVTFTFTVGATSTPLSENFDGVTAPALPAGWVSTVPVGNASPWVTSTAVSDTAPNNALALTTAVVNDIRLTSPSVPIMSNSAQLTFRHNYNLEAGDAPLAFDGGVLEMSVNGGPFADIITAGGMFVTGGYTRTLSNDFGNPLGGRQAWSASSNGYITTTVKLPATLAGKTIRLRWRLGSDSQVGGGGWRVDTISLVDGLSCCGLTCPTVASINPTNGPVGQSVTITGTNFTGVTSVKFANNVTATFSIIDNSTITATVPSGAVSGPITLSKPGCGDVQTGNFTVNQPCPTINGLISPIRGPIGTTVTITGTNFTGVNSVKFSNNVAATFTVVNATTITTVVPSGAVSGPITISKPGCGDVQTSNFTIVVCPTIGGISPASGPIGTQVTITGSGFNGVDSVKFNNNVTATFTVVNNTTIHAIVPSGAISGPITISEPGCGDVQTGNFSVTTCPTITNFNPGSAAVGSQVTITGSGFTGVNSVKFASNVAATFTVVNDTTITTTVPAGAVTGPITISEPGCGDTQTASFTVIVCPTITGINPNIGPVGTQVTISGSGFTGVNSVKFHNNITATFTVVNDTTITTTVPSGVTTGAITISKPGCGETQTANFTVVVCPTVTGISPTSGAVGTQVTISGAGFNGVNSVKFSNNVAATFTVVNSATIHATVPAGAVTGPITLSEPGCGDTQTASFTVIVCPTITGINPTSGVVGSQVTISGSGFTGVSSVKFSNNVTATFTVVNDTTITATVPSGAVSGPITINKPGCGETQTASFAVIVCPTISGISPTSGVAGSQVTISGSGFTGVNAVKFSSNVTATFTVVNDTTITTTVPANAVSGPITLSEPGCGDTQTASFTVIVCPTITGISPTSGIVGSQVTITGANFTGVSGVKFSNNVAATFTVVNDTTITTTVPSGAVTGPITINKPGCGETQTASFTVIICPTISGINPTSGVAGSQVTITGAGFIGVDSVKFSNNVAAAFTVVNDTTITTTVPNGAVSGPITLNKPGCGETQTASFTVIVCPTITGINPTSGVVGSQVTISGTGLTGVDSVKFSNNVTATFTVVNDSTITATVPSGAVSGPITLHKPGCGDTQTASFTVIVCPTITGINPTGGVVGSSVTISGSGFTGVNSVKFSNNVTATFTVVNDTTITTTVPSGAVTGPITLNKPGCGETQTASFTVIVCPTITGINPTGAMVGDQITISGSGFTGVNAVKFSSNVAAAFTVVNDTVITATVPAGAVTGPITLSEPGCGDTQTASFTVIPPCIPVVIANNITGSPGSSITIPITVGSLTGRGVTAFDFVLSFDPAVIKPSSTPVDNAGTLSSGFTITANGGVAGKLSVSAFGIAPLTGAGTLLNLKFDLIGAPNACTDVAWTNFKFNEGTPCSTLSNGQICMVGGSISGTVTYGTSQTTKPVPGVVVTAAGTPSATSTTNNDGNYNLLNLGSGPYTVTPTKTGQVNGISALDASLVSQHVAGLITLTPNQQIAGDASGNGSLSAFDASLIAQTAAGVTNPGIAGTWKFVPANRSYPSVGGILTGQNFEAILIGDVSGNWTPPAVPEPSNGSEAMGKVTTSFESSTQINAVTQTTVTLPQATGANGANVTIAITTTDLAGLDVKAYDFTINFDPTVLQLQAAPTDAAGTLSQGLTIIPNAGTPGKLIVSAFGTNALTGAGTLLNLKFTVVGAAGSSTPLTWQTFNYNEGTPTSTAVSGTFSVPSPCSFSIAPTNQSFDANAGTGSVTVTATSGCNWTAVSNNAFITVTSGASGTGNGAVNFSVAANASTTPRSGTVTIAGQTFTVNQAGANPAPALTSLSPNSANAGGAAFTLTVNGTGFINGSVVQWNGSNRATTYVSATQLTAAITAADIAAAGTASVTVSTPAPGGGVSSALSFTINPPAPRIVRVVSVSVAPGNVVNVPIELEAQGNENALGFSLTFDPSLLSLPQAALGPDASAATLNFNSSQAAQGRLGIVLALPAGQSFAAGTRRVVVVSFTVAPGTNNATTPVAFGDQPVTRELVDVNANTLPATFTPGTVTITPQGYEADVSPRPNGNNNGSVTTADWVQVGRFAAGTDTAASGSEFQRADCAPKETLGDGRITIADWVQAGRYAAGLDPVTAAGGPTAPVPEAGVGNPAMATTAGLEGSLTRGMRVKALSCPAGQDCVLTVEIDARGGENAAGLSLNFDPSQLRFIAANVGRDASGATINVNTSQTGRGQLGLALALPAGQTLPAGTLQLVTLTFSRLNDSRARAIALGFTDYPVARELVDANARQLPASYAVSEGLTNIRTAANVSAASFNRGVLASEALVSAFGTNLATATQAVSALPLPTTLAGTQVTIIDSTGVEHQARLFFVSPTQVNYQLPPNVAPGLATVSITSGDGTVSMDTLDIAPVAPGLFAANSNGQGVATAVAVRVAADGGQSFEPVATFDAAQGKYVTRAIDLGAENEQVVLLLFGTGIRHRSALSNVTVSIGGVQAQVDYAGAQPDFAGLDQLNVHVPRSLIGHGEVDIVVTVDQRTANTVKVKIR